MVTLTEYENLYNLPTNWEKKDVSSFCELVDTIEQIHTTIQYSAIKAVNRYATVRNYLIGFYIVEYEQNGNDRASYGEKLLKRLSETINVKGINETLLKNSRRFYIEYPQIKQYLSGAKSPTTLDLSEISRRSLFLWFLNNNDILYHPDFTSRSGLFVLYCSKQYFCLIIGDIGENSYICHTKKY